MIKNNFKNEYILIYKDKKSYDYHINKIKKDLTRYFSTVPFINNTAPIVVNEYIEIGTIIKLGDNSLNSMPNNFENNFKNQDAKINAQNYINNYLITKEGEKIIAVIFVSMNCSDIANYALVCKESDLFSTLEERLYLDFPQFRGRAFFMCNTRQIDRNKTLNELNIKNNSIINVFTIEN